jgi:hypothetical protein
MFVLFLVDYFAPHMPSISLLSGLLDKHGVLDFLDFASYMFDNDTSAFRSGLSHSARSLRSRSANNTPLW